jgi:hypothetical protein
MKRSVIIISLAAVLVVVIGLFLYLRYRPEPPAPVDESDDQRIAISRFDVDLIESIELNNEHGTLTFLKVPKEPEEGEETDGGTDSEEGEEEGGEDSEEEPVEKVWTVDYAYPIPVDDGEIRDLAYTFAGLYSERVVEKRADDLAKYGLDKPSATGKALLSDGETVELYLGDKTPAGNTWYLKAKDDPTVYAIWMNHAENLQFSLYDVRDKELPPINTNEITYLRISKKGEPSVKLFRRPGEPEEIVDFRVAPMDLEAHYTDQMPVSMTGVEEFYEMLPEWKIKEFVDDRPVDLARYGLDDPSVEFVMKDLFETLFLQYGKVEGDKIYYKQYGKDPVYAMPLADIKFMDVDPFDLIDKFVFIVNIEWVDEIRKELEDPEAKKIEDMKIVTSYHVDDKEVEENVFKTFYRSVVGLFYDAEYRAPLDDDAEVTVTFAVNRGNVPDYRFSYVPYDVDFYAVVDHKGVSDFLISRAQLGTMLDDLEALVAGELEPTF